MPLKQLNTCIESIFTENINLVVKADLVEYGYGNDAGLDVTK